jgi:hypothetical protein
MIKEMKPGGNYFIVNNDEPYIENLYEVIKKGQTAKVERPDRELSWKGSKMWERDNPHT